MQAVFKERLPSMNRGMIYILTSIFLVVMTLGMLSGMTEMGDGEMIGCPMMGDTAVLCDMDVTEHLQMWSNMTVSIVQELAPLLVLIAFVGFSLLRRVRLLCQEKDADKVQDSDVPIWIVFNHLRKALSSGVLHPKIFPGQL